MSGITNRVGKVLVTNGLVAANLADASVGKYLIINQDNITVTSATVLTPSTKIQVLVNSPSGQKIKSDWITVKDLVSYQKEVFRAKVEGSYTLTPGAPVAGNEYKIIILEKSDREILTYRQAKRTYSVIAAAGETATTLADKFRAKINADPASIVVASGTVTLILTAKAQASTTNQAGDFNYQFVFDVFATTGALSPASYTTDFQKFGTEVKVQADFGSGNFWQIRKLERELIGHTGVTNRTLFPFAAGDFSSVSGVNYDTFVIEHDNDHSTNAVNIGKFKAPITTYIAVTAGASAGVGSIGEILDKLAV